MGRRALVTRRDLAVLSFAGEQFGVPMATAAELLARHAAATRPLGASAAATVARRTAARLEAGGYADRLTVAGEVWLIPTRRGAGPPGRRTTGLRGVAAGRLEA